MGLFKVKRNVSGYSFLFCILLLSIIIFYENVIDAMFHTKSSENFLTTHPPLTMPTANNKAWRLPQLLSSLTNAHDIDQWGQHKCLLQKLRNDELNVQDPCIKKTMRYAYTFCTCEVLTFLISKGITFDDDCVNYLVGSPGNVHLPNLLDNQKILLKAGYKWRLQHVWLKKIILFLCRCCVEDSVLGCSIFIPVSYGSLALDLLEAGPTPNEKYKLSFSKNDKTYSNALCRTLRQLANNQHMSKERIYSIIKALWASGGDLKQIDDDCKNMNADNFYMPGMLRLLSTLDENRVAIFRAIETRDLDALKILARCTPFLIQNAEGDSPLHFAIKKVADPLGEERDKSLVIVGVILRVLPRLMFEINTKEKCTPIVLIIGFKQSLLPKLRELCAQKANEAGRSAAT